MELVCLESLVSSEILGRNVDIDCVLVSEELGIDVKMVASPLVVEDTTGKLDLDGSVSLEKEYSSCPEVVVPTLLTAVLWER